MLSASARTSIAHEYAADKARPEAGEHRASSPVPKDLDVAELAAWTSVARVILNLHETITRNESDGVLAVSTPSSAVDRQKLRRAGRLIGR